ncbi:hypothetical protein SARC_00893 [Sphaeroforma arctica JP610]|uniref:Proteasome subunit alpha type-4 n=1 Tax=Sphaeroforma arctica JP610 TaxID=667725 RepID=A0A0L0GDB4_9EUKA|nr:hypothetical protein SARC_00893 [Sphaeroforma arctica JP610]KNC87000.1 hypothetical protein SARC_00893 [Sphaeroforma arctica JP610]|eukprot:XP_014160902.1 hypothetical protein SARC_00893 [Sphaeroforma arctica JP610]
MATFSLIVYHAIYTRLRPFGVSFLYTGWDKHFGFQLYQSDPSGNYGGWKAACIGSNSQAAQSILKTDYSEDMSLDDALMLAVKVLTKTMDSTTLSSEKLEFATLSRRNGKTVFEHVSAKRTDELLTAGKKILEEKKLAEQREKAKLAKK